MGRRSDLMRTEREELGRVKFKGYRRELRAIKRVEAEIRNARTPYERTRYYRQSS
jgi:hypothetical protein